MSERARDARVEADKLAFIAWSQRMLAFRSPLNPPRCWETLSMPGSVPRGSMRWFRPAVVDLWTERRAKVATPIHELERRMACKDCSQIRGYQYKRGQLVAMRQTPNSANDPPSVWWPGER